MHQVIFRFRCSPLTCYSAIFLSSFLWSCTSTSDNIPEGFVIQDGFSLTLVASEPLIKDPVDIEFDEDGDAYVLEMPGYPYEDQQSRIVLLQDEDADGVFEGSVVFAADLELASSIMPFDEGLLVAAPPYLLYVADTDGDLKADQRDTLMGGFSTGNLQHNYNGLTYGIDGWIYAANGGNSGQPFWWGDPSSKIELTGDDFKFHIGQKKIKKIGPSSGGFELGIDEWGEVYGTHNLEHVNQIIYPRDYGKLQGQPADFTLVNISNHEENGLSRVYPVGEQESRVNHPEQSGYFSGACGITYYDNGALGSKLENSIWVTDVVLNLIHVDHLESDGSIKAASRIYDRSEFLASSDRSFRPVNISIGPDGALYVVDMYRQVIEHPEWIPDEIEKTLDLDAGKDKGRIYKITSSRDADETDEIYTKLQSDDIISDLLSHHNQWVRNTAHRLLATRAETWSSAKREVHDLLSSDSEQARLHALHLLDIHQELTPHMLLGQFETGSAPFRKEIIKLAEKYINVNSEIINTVANNLLHEHPLPRMQAALSLSLASRASKEAMATIMIKNILASLKLENDKWNWQALALASRGFESTIFKHIADGKVSSSEAAFLSLLTQSSLADVDQLKKIINIVSFDDIEADIKFNCINTIAANISAIPTSRAFEEAVEELDAGGDVALLGAIQVIRSELGLSASEEFSRSLVQAGKSILDQDKSVEERLSWLNLLKTRSYASSAETLSHLLQYDQPEKLQSSALEILWSHSDAAVGHMLVDNWDVMSPRARRTASDILLYKEMHHDALLTALESDAINIGEMNFDLERRRTLLWWTDDESTKSRAQALFTDAGVVTRDSVITYMKASLGLEGNIENGSEVFDQLCGQCHTYGPQGYEVGPALTEISRKSKESLLYDILDPNAAVDSKYINHKITLNDGQVHLGIIYSEDDASVSIRKMAGVTVAVDKADIAEFRSLGTSFMMEGLEANLDHQSMADLLTFLQKG